MHTKANIIIVRDSQDKEPLLSAAFFKANIVQEMTSCEQVESILEKKAHHLLVLFLNTPGAFNAFDLIRNLRKKSKIQILAISRKTDLEEVRVAMRFGATDFLTAPFDAASFEERVQGLLIKQVGN